MNASCRFLAVVAFGTISLCLWSTVLATQPSSRPQTPLPVHIPASLPLWPNAELGVSNLKDAQLALEMRRVFKGAKSAAEARSKAVPFWKKSYSSVPGALKALWAVYFVSVIVDFEIAVPEGFTAWKHLVKNGDPSNPEHARAACLASVSLMKARVSSATAKEIFLRYDDVPELMMLRQAYLVGLKKTPPDPGHEIILSEMRRRLLHYPKGLVLDASQDEANSRYRMQIACAASLTILSSSSRFPKALDEAEVLLAQVAKSPGRDPITEDRLKSFTRALEFKKKLKN